MSPAWVRFRAYHPPQTSTERIANHVYEMHERRHPAITLQNAIKHLEPLGEGGNLEYSRARFILQYALGEVVRGGKS